MSKRHVSAVVNGDPVEFLCAPEQTLLDVLRDELELTALAAQVFASSSGVRHAHHARADGQLEALDLHTGHLVGQERAHLHRPAQARGQRAAPVELGGGARLSHDFLERNLKGHRHGMQDGQRRIGLTRLEVGPGGAGQPRELGHLLLGQAARLAQLTDVAAQATR